MVHPESSFHPNFLQSSQYVPYRICSPGFRFSIISWRWQLILLGSFVEGQKYEHIFDMCPNVYQATNMPYALHWNPTQLYWIRTSNFHPLFVLRPIRSDIRHYRDDLQFSLTMPHVPQSLQRLHHKATHKPGVYERIECLLSKLKSTVHHRDRVTLWPHNWLLERSSEASCPGRCSYLRAM